MKGDGDQVWMSRGWSIGDGLDLKEGLTMGGKSTVRGDSSFINSQETEIMNRRAAEGCWLEELGATGVQRPILTSLNWKSQWPAEHKCLEGSWKERSALKKAMWN